MGRNDVGMGTRTIERPSGRWSLMNSALLLVLLAMPFVMIGSFVTGLIILIGKPSKAISDVRSVSNRHQTAITPRSRDL